ncbi:MAG: DnaB-like helicase C-terminal domain-containing protein [Sandaracinaceae bacterium]
MTFEHDDDYVRSYLEQLSEKRRAELARELLPKSDRAAFGKLTASRKPVSHDDALRRITIGLDARERQARSLPGDEGASELLEVARRRSDLVLVQRALREGVDLFSDDGEAMDAFGEAHGASPSWIDVVALVEVQVDGRLGWGPYDDVTRWALDGPLVQEPTGFAELDALTGGLGYGSLWVLAGPPNAWKTLLLVHLADTLGLREPVGLLAVDDTQITTRLLQRRGFARARVQRCLYADLEDFNESLSTALEVYKEPETIESAAERVARRCRGGRGALFVDSIQTAKSEAVARGERGDPTSETAIRANCEALRNVARRHNLIVVATSEMPRSSYTGRRGDAMAAGKGSGAIEYFATVQIVLTAIEDETAVRAEVPKNKLGTGRRAMGDAAPILEGDRATQTVRERDRSSEDRAVAAADATDAEQDREHAERVQASVDELVRKLAASKQPVTTDRGLRALLGGNTGIKVEAIRLAKASGLIVQARRGSAWTTGGKTNDSGGRCVPGHIAKSRPRGDTFSSAALRLVSPKSGTQRKPRKSPES